MTSTVCVPLLAETELNTICPVAKSPMCVLSRYRLSYQLPAQLSVVLIATDEPETREFGVGLMMLTQTPGAGVAVGDGVELETGAGVGVEVGVGLVLATYSTSLAEPSISEAGFWLWLVTSIVCRPLA